MPAVKKTKCKLKNPPLNKHLKLIPIDPFKNRFEDVRVLVPNMCTVEVCRRLSTPIEGENVLYEIKSYKCSVKGKIKTFCGETGFIETSKIAMVLSYEKEKKERFLEYLKEIFPGIVFL